MYKTQDEEEYIITTIRVRKDDLKALREIGKEDKRSMNSMVNMLIINFLEMNCVKDYFIEFD